MGQALRKGQVLWYDRARGYGFIRTLKSEQTIFITQGSLDAIGVTRLPEGMEIEFDVIKGKASDMVDNIIQIGPTGRIQ